MHSPVTARDLHIFLLAGDFYCPGTEKADQEGIILVSFTREQ